MRITPGQLRRGNLPGQHAFFGNMSAPGRRFLKKITGRGGRQPRRARESPERGPDIAIRQSTGPRQRSLVVPEIGIIWRAVSR